MFLAAALGLSAATSLAATVSVLGPGVNPRVAVDAAGNGHFTWAETKPSGGDVFRYCRVPRGGGACNASTVRNNGEQNLTGGYALLPGGARVLLLEARCCTVYAQKYLYSSGNGGTSFDAGLSPGFENQVGANIAGEALYAPANALGPGPERVLTISGAQTIGLSFQASGTTSASTFNSGIMMAEGNAYDGSLARSGSTLVSAWSTISPPAVLWRSWNGGANLNSQGSWTVNAVAGPANIYANTRLAGGPSGVYVSYSTGALGKEAFVLRRFTGSGFGPPLTLTETGSPRFGDLYQDPTGRLHFAWADSSGNLRYRYSVGAGLSSPQTLTGPRTDGNFAGLRLAADATGRGFVTWNFYSTPGTVKSVPFAPNLPAPALGRTVNVQAVKGAVYISVPPGTATAAKSVPGIKGRNFVPLTEVRQVPVGSLLDARKGTVRLTSATNSKGGTKAGDFAAGVFQVLQSRKASSKGLVELRLRGSSFKRCRAGKSGRAATIARLSRRTIRRLRGNAKGRYRTRGRYSAATVRGTSWTTSDRCDGTLTAVKRGKVVVRDFRRRRNITVRTGRRYLAKAPG